MPAARAQGGVPAVGARSMARCSSRPGSPRILDSRLRSRCALGTFRSRRLQQELRFRLRVGSLSGTAPHRIPAAPSVCRGEAAASLLPSCARRQLRGNHGDGAHPGRAASLKGQASRRGIPPPLGTSWGPGRRRPPSLPAPSGPPGPPQAAPPALRRTTGKRLVPLGLTQPQGRGVFLCSKGVLREPGSLSSPGGTWGELRRGLSGGCLF